MNRVHFADIANIKMGQSPEGEYCNSNGEGMPLLNGPTEFTNFSPLPKQYTTNAKRISGINEILFCVRGSTTGRMNWSDRNYAIGRGLASISHKKGNEYNFFLKYLIHSNLKSILNTTNGSTFPNLTSDILGSFEFLIPELKVQHKIAGFLSTIDSKIELNNRINAELETMAKTLYDYWFVQFDFPNQEGKPYKSSGGKMVWDKDLMKDIPEGWKVNELKVFANTASGGTPLSTKKEYYENGTIPWINSGELNAPFIIEGKNFITKEGLDKSSAKLFEANTLLVAMYGATAGKVSLLKIKACTNQAICAILPDSIVYTNFLKFAFDDLYKHMINLSTGSARDNLSQDLIKDLKFVLSPNELFEKFNEIVNPIIDKISINMKQNQQLTFLRDWLLPILMNGQVKVGDMKNWVY